MSVFRARKERSDRENVALRAADERDTKGYFDTDARGGYLDRRKAPRPMPPPRVETKGRDEFAATRATRGAFGRRRRRDAFGRSPPTPPPPKTAEELEMERAFAAFDAEEDEPAEDANRRGDGGRREYEPAVGGYARGGRRVPSVETKRSLTEAWRRNVVDTIGVSRATSLSSRALAPSIVSLTARFVSGLGTRTRSFPRRHTRRVRPRSTSPIAPPGRRHRSPFGTRRRSVRPSVP